MKYEDGEKGFPQLIYFDGRNLTTTALCGTWFDYSKMEFEAGGMDFAHAYDMMHQVVSENTKKRTFQSKTKKKMYVK